MYKHTLKNLFYFATNLEKKIFSQSNIENGYHDVMK